MCDLLKTLSEIGCTINWEYVITILTILGSSAAIIVSVITAKKQRTADIVTKNRMEWIQAFRKTISDYYAKVKLFEDKQAPERISEYLNELYVFESRIKLHLNCFGKNDAVIIKYVAELNMSYDAFLHKSALSKKIKDQVELSKEMLEYIAIYKKSLLDDLLSKSIKKYDMRQMIEDKKYDQFLDLLNGEAFKEESVINLLKMESLFMRECCAIIRYLPEILLIYAQIYLKVEWERVKIESKKGDIKNFDFDKRFHAYIEEKREEIDKFEKQLPSRIFE